MTKSIDQILAIADKKEIARIESLIDPCSFGTVIDHYLHDNLIHFVVIVHEPFDLAQISAVISGGEIALDSLTYSEMFQHKMISPAFPDERIATEESGITPIRFVDIGRRRKVYVFYAPPFYIVKLTKDQWI